MEILHNLWSVLVTENENLIKYITLFLGIIEMYVVVNLFTETLNIKSTKKQRKTYYICMFVYLLCTNFIIPDAYSIFTSIILLPLIIKYSFKISILKSVLAELLILFTTLIIETIYLKLCYIVFNISIELCINIPIYRIPFMLFIYLTIFLLSKATLFIKLNLDVFEHLLQKNKTLVLLNLFFILLCIGMQFYLLLFYNNVLPVCINIISLISLIIYACVSIYSITKTINLELTKRDLEQSQLHNKTLQLLYNNTSAFKHDFSNILTALGGYIYTKDLDGLEMYYKKILDECHINNNLSTLNPSIINNPAIYNILANKYYKADELGININLEIFINLDDLKINIYDFCRIFGILLDNAIEAASECNNKLININIHDMKTQKYQILSIENTYKNKNIDLSNLGKKGYTTKSDTNSHGIGLWQVSRILKKYPNVIIDTNKTDEYFKQELIIYI